jgi:hypothetical protein
MTEYEKLQLRLKCVEVTLAACMRADIQRDEGLVFADKVFEWVMKVQDKKKKETPA